MLTLVAVSASEIGWVRRFGTLLAHVSILTTAEICQLWNRSRRFLIDHSLVAGNLALFGAFGCTMTLASAVTARHGWLGGTITPVSHQYNKV